MRRDDHRPAGAVAESDVGTGLSHDAKTCALQSANELS